MPRSIRTLLLVEPHEMTRELYVRELAREWRVLACADRLTALRYLETELIDVLVMEPVAPGDDHWSLLETVRKHPTTSAMPVVICSAVDERRRGIELGVTVYLVKPVAPRALSDQVRTVVAAQTSAASQSEL
jgi:DNA-binding response OmpR family regulator